MTNQLTNYLSPLRIPHTFSKNIQKCNWLVGSWFYDGRKNARRSLRTKVPFFPIFPLGPHLVLTISTPCIPPFSVGFIAPSLFLKGALCLRLFFGHRETVWPIRYVAMFPPIHSAAAARILSRRHGGHPVSRNWCHSRSAYNVAHEDLEYLRLEQPGLQ